MVSSPGAREYVHARVRGYVYAPRRSVYAFVSILLRYAPLCSLFGLGLVGWLTTYAREFIDASTTGCHYQKRECRGRFSLLFKGVVHRRTGRNDFSNYQTEFLGCSRFYAHS